MAFYMDRAKGLDYSDPAAVADMCKSFLDDESLDVAQRLFAVGFVLNKNKEQYIQGLKSDNKQYKNTITQLQNKIRELKKLVPEGAPKKKVVIIKKKVV